MAKSRNNRGDGDRRRTITDAVPSPHLADLTLTELREYRRRLTEEEDKVSYWRRLAHARIDVLQAEASSDGALSMEQLVRVLGDTGTGHSRKALVNVSAAEPLPDLPELEEMWVTEVDPADPEKVADAIERIRAAEQQLTDYRRALHERIDEATGELISRYRDEPGRALGVLSR
jgi:hypothetical protein